jgi:hypothetical protein
MEAGWDSVVANVLSVFRGASTADGAAVAADLFSTTDQLIFGELGVYAADETLAVEIVDAGAALLAVL